MTKPLPPSAHVAELATLIASLWRWDPSLPVDLDRPLHALGMDSIQLAELGGKLQERYGLDIAAPHLFALTPRGIATLIQSGPSAASPLARSGAATSYVPAAAPLTPARTAPAAGPAKTLRFSLFHFGEHALSHDSPYELLLETARVADDLGFHAIWLPERHFHPFGGISPNPSVLAAALSQTTRRLRLRAGSVILPLHNPLRVCEEWALVDRLSHGRVDIAFGWGWNADDFVLAPERFANRRQLTLDDIETVEQLWQGNPGRGPNGRGETVPFRLFPTPVQRRLPVWLTCTSAAESFIEAGARGHNVLTALLFQTIEELELKIALYRAARERHGHDPGAGEVTVMLHTFVGSSDEQVYGVVRRPFGDYLRSSASLWMRGSTRLEELEPSLREAAIEHGFERYYRSAGLFGTPESCAGLVAQLARAGVNEIACLVDFGVDRRSVVEALRHLNVLREASALSCIASQP